MNTFTYLSLVPTAAPAVKASVPHSAGETTSANFPKLSAGAQILFQDGVSSKFMFCGHSGLPQGDPRSLEPPYTRQSCFFFLFVLLQKKYIILCDHEKSVSHTI